MMGHIAHCASHCRQFACGRVLQQGTESTEICSRTQWCVCIPVSDSYISDCLLPHVLDPEYMRRTRKSVFATYFEVAATLRNNLVILELHLLAFTIRLARNQT